MRGRVARAVWLLACVFFMVFLLFALDLYRFATIPFPLANTEIHYIFESGTNVTRMSQVLYQEGVLKHTRYKCYFRILASMTGNIRKLHAGEYRIDNTITPWALLRHMAKGEVIYYDMVFIEGWTFKHMLQALQANPYLEHVTATLSNQQILKQLGSEYSSPEGLFFPENYHFTRGTQDIKLLQWAYTAMQTQLQNAWQERAQGLPYANAYDALIIASLIEKETASKEEREKIAGVLVRRLQKKMRLQCDPTVIYGLGEAFVGNLTRQHLKQDTPYNTYLHKGLPPTPIAIPSAASIQAALHPAAGEELFFVAKGDGTHVFSNTHQVHKRWVARYQLHQSPKQSESVNQVRFN